MTQLTVPLMKAVTLLLMHPDQQQTMAWAMFQMFQLMSRSLLRQKLTMI
jgi:hypothetical protein